MCHLRKLDAVGCMQLTQCNNTKRFATNLNWEWNKWENSEFQNYTYQFLAYIPTAFLAEFLSDKKLWVIIKITNNLPRTCKTTTEKYSWTIFYTSMLHICFLESCLYRMWYSKMLSTSDTANRTCRSSTVLENHACVLSLSLLINICRYFQKNEVNKAKSVRSKAASSIRKEILFWFLTRVNFASILFDWLGNSCTMNRNDILS